MGNRSEVGGKKLVSDNIHQYFQRKEKRNHDDYVSIYFEHFFRAKQALRLIIRFRNDR